MMKRKSLTEKELVDVNVAIKWLSDIGLPKPEFPQDLQKILLTNLPGRNEETKYSVCEYFHIVRLNGIPTEGEVYQHSKDDIPIITSTLSIPPPPAPQPSSSPSKHDDNRPFTVSDRILLFGSDTLRFETKKVRENLTLSTATACTLTSSSSSLCGSNDDDEGCARKVLSDLSTKFKKHEHNEYRWEDKFKISVDTIEALCEAAFNIFSSEKSLLELRGTTYVFGDIHGNYNDLIRFTDIFAMPLSLKLFDSNFLFLGDYVDRGEYGIETVLYLFSFKILHPYRIFLLRGNHEAAQVNSDVNAYGENAFREQCIRAYGCTDGDRIWKSINRAFDMLPFCATIDKKIFCVHGGIPKAVCWQKDLDVLGTLSNIPRPWTSDNRDLENFLKDPRNAFLFELLWNDPIPSNESQKEMITENPRGFGAYRFSKSAINLFYKKTGFTHIIRAHESKSPGVDLQARGTLFTVFSTSNYSGRNNAATILIHNKKINIIALNVDNQSNYFDYSSYYDYDFEEEEEEEEVEEEEDEII